MKGVISAQSIGAVAPYLVSATLMIPLMTPTANTTMATGAEACVFMDVVQLNRALGADDLTNYSWDLTHPELAPDTFVRVARREAYETYEPFIASEGWREMPTPRGPFVVDEEPPRAFFDDYDLSAIALYESE